jgi:hypothetical protein
VQVRGRQRLVLETLELFRVEHGGEGQDLQRDVAAERDLLGFVHDRHAAAAQLTDQAIVAERSSRMRVRGVVGGETRRRAVDEVDAEERRLQFFREVGMPLEQRLAVRRVPGFQGLQVLVEDFAEVAALPPTCPLIARGSSCRSPAPFIRPRVIRGE